MYKLTLTVRNLHFIVKIHDAKILKVIQYVTHQLTTFTKLYNRFARRVYVKQDAIYYTYNVRDDEYRFPIAILKQFISILGYNGIKREDIELIKDEDVNITVCKYDWNKSFILRDYQENYVKVIIENMSSKTLLIDAQTGTGKSCVISYIIQKLKYRVCFVLLPKYIKKWISDVKLYFPNITDEDILVVQGSESLVDLMTEESISYKIIIFSIVTLNNYINSYETKDVFNYPITPQYLMKYLNIGIIINDETHQHFNMLNKILLYFDSILFLGSSATFDTHQSTLKKIYNMVIPINKRVSNLVKVEPYVFTKAISYRLQIDKKIKYRRAKGYNHILYEQSIMYNSIFRRHYFEMINYYLQEGYFKLRKSKDDKVVVFFASIDMCNAFTEYLIDKYPNENVYRYVGGDDYNIMIESSIIISNNAMLSTGIDLKNLILCIMTISMSSYQANIQNFGRLRDIKDRDIWYYYIYCKDIINQVKMHKDREELLYPRSRIFLKEEYQYLIKTS